MQFTQRQPQTTRKEIPEMLALLAGLDVLIDSIAYETVQQAGAATSDRRYNLQQNIGTLHTHACRLVHLATQLGSIDTEGGQQ